MFDFINEIINIKGSIAGSSYLLLKETFPYLSLKETFPIYYKAFSPYDIISFRVFAGNHTEGEPTLFYNINMQTILTYA